MPNSKDLKPKPGDVAILLEVPPGFLDDLPVEDQQAIKEVVGKPIQLNEYDEDGRAELEFKDSNGNFHKIWVSPDFIRCARPGSKTGGGKRQDSGHLP